MATPARYLRTLRTLTPGQVGWRLVHEVRFRAYRAAPGLWTNVWLPDPGGRIAMPPVTAPPPDLLDRERAVARRWLDGRVEYLDVEGDASDWLGSGRPRLWRYERHYHSELVPLAALAAAEPSGGWLEAADAMVESWCRVCPPPRGDGWEPYPVARRILNGALAAALAPGLGPRLAPLLHTQLRFLRGHLERHLLGNHLLCDAAALVAGSAVLDAKGAEDIGHAGVRLLADQLERQVLPDGGYAERTAQYHAILLRDVLVATALWRRRGRPVDGRIEIAARRMLAWVAAVRRGDAFPWLNDAAPGATPPALELLSLGRALGLSEEAGGDGWLARALGAPPGDASPVDPPRNHVELPDTGWSIVRDGGSELLLEHGPIGPREQPGHGHSDALSFELSWDGHPVVTDTGVTTYEADATRAYERSAAAHACVTVGGDGPDELWGAFRVGARGRVGGRPAQRKDGGGWLLRGAVTAPAGWTHHRVLAFWPGRALVVVDEVAGAPGSVRSHLPLDPAVHLQGTTLEVGPAMLEFRVLRSAGGPRTQEGWVGRGFGRREPRKILELDAGSDGVIAWALQVPGMRVELGDRRCGLLDEDGRRIAEMEWD